MARRDAADLAIGETNGVRRDWRWALLGLALTVPIILAEAVTHGSLVLTPGLLVIALVLGLVTAWVLEHEVRLLAEVRATRALRSPSQDRFTIGGMLLWVAGTLVAATVGIDDPARGLASAVALGGLSGWVAGPLRTAIRRRLSGQGGPLASWPTLVVLALGTAAAVVTLVAALVLWATT